MAQTSYKPIGQMGPDLYKVYDTQDFALGTVVPASSVLGAAEFVFLKGVASCVEGSVVTYREKDHTAILLAANAIGNVGVAVSAVVATKFGWFQVRGKAVAKAAAGYADDALVYATATGGVIDDAVVAGDRVKCARSCSALDTPATGFAYLDMRYPFMDDATAA